MHEHDPKDLEKPLVLIKPGHWMTLGCFAVIFMGVVAAALFGSIPIRVEGEGLFFNPSQIFNVTSPAEGRVSRIDVHLGSQVKKGDPVVEIEPHRDIFSEQEGTVFAIEVFGGSKVGVGQPLIWLQKKSDEPLQMTGLIPHASSQHVQVGMPVEITVQSADPVEYGRAIGKVAALIPFWTSRSRDLFPTRYLPIAPGDNTFTHLIVVELTPNPDVPSGIDWTSGNGPPFTIKLGTPCTFTVITEKKKPISYLFK